MSDWRDVMDARAEADRLARSATDTPHLPTVFVVDAILALRAEVRALSVVIDYATKRQS